MNQPSDSIRTIRVEMFGGPADGALIVIPVSEDGVYGLVTGPSPYWPGFLVRKRHGRYILEWKDIEAQSTVYEEGLKLMEKFEELGK